MALAVRVGSCVDLVTASTASNLWWQRVGLGAAIEVVDRWHLWRNLRDATEKLVRAHRTCLTPLDTARTGRAG